MMVGFDICFIGIIELVVGFNVVEFIVDVIFRFCGLMFGVVDMVVDIGVIFVWEFFVLVWVRIVVVCVMKGFFVIDVFFFDIGDFLGLKEEMLQVFSFGFFVKLVIYFVQISVINVVFIFIMVEINYVCVVLIENVKGVGIVSGMMIDEVVVCQVWRLFVWVGIFF